MASESNSLNKDSVHGTDMMNESTRSENIRRPSNSSSSGQKENPSETLPQPQTSVIRTVDINPDYMEMSSYLRSSICFGYPVLRASHSKAVHNAQVFKEHREMMASEQKQTQRSCRRRKDWLGRWTEANIIRERLLKEMLAAEKKPSSTSGAVA